MAIDVNKDLNAKNENQDLSKEQEQEQEFLSVLSSVANNKKVAFFWIFVIIKCYFDWLHIIAFQNNIIAKLIFARCSSLIKPLRGKMLD